MNYKPVSRIPWLFTDFDNIKDFPWLFKNSLTFPWPWKIFVFPWLFPDRGNPGFRFKDENDYEYQIWLKVLWRILQN